MKDYLEKRREELSKREGGFTLMEMLIVVAIIAVLIAIAIPIFTTQLEKSRESTDVANIRGAYAAATVAAMTGKVGASDVDYSKTYYYDPGVDGSLSSGGVALGQGTGADGKLDLGAISSYSSYANNTDAQGKKIEVAFDATTHMVSSINFAS